MPISATNRLLKPNRVLLFGSEAEARPDSDVASKPVHLDVRVEQQTAAEARLRKANEGELAVANERFRNVAAYMKNMPQCSESAVPARTLRAGSQLIRAAEINLGSGYLGLLPEPRRGNTTPKTARGVARRHERVHRVRLRDAKTENAIRLLDCLKLACDRRRILPPSYKAFSTAVLRRPGFEQTLKRQGPRRCLPAGKRFIGGWSSKTARTATGHFEIATLIIRNSM